MKPLELAKTRYSTKVYDSGKKIPQEKIEELKKILHLAPSSIDIQPWKFTFVQNELLKSKLAEASLHNKDKINQARLLIVFSFVEDLEAFQKVVDKDLPKGLAEMYNNSKISISEQDLKIWFSRQVYIALGMGLSAAIALGLDSTPMEGLEPDRYMEILNMKDYRPICAMAVGYASADDYNRLEVQPKSRRPFDQVVQSID